MTTAKLIIRSPGKPEQEVRLTGGASIGRAFDNSIRVEVDGVSRYHAIVEQRADGFWLSDLGSRNGTTVNGVAVSGDRKLEDGELLMLGGTATLQFRIETGGDAGNGSHSDGAKSADSSAPESKSESSFGKKALLIGLGIVVVVVGVFVIAQLVSSRTGVDRGKAGSAASTGGTSGGIAGGQSANAEKPGIGAAAGANETTPVVVIPKPNGPGGDGAEREAGSGSESGSPVDLRITQECQKLASLIVSKNGSGYVFDPAFVADVLRHVDEYRIDLKDPVQAHRFQINKAFGATPVHKITGYLLAISRSKFKDDQVDPGAAGLWRVPRSIALSYKTPEESDAIINQPDRAADIAAQYFKSLINVFGPDDFMYAIACFGMPISAAGAMRNALDKAGPIDRRDFWGMAKKGVVPAEGVDRVVRFFAAGIAAENPIGKGNQPLSWLISN